MPRREAMKKPCDRDSYSHTSNVLIGRKGFGATAKNRLHITTKKSRIMMILIFPAVDALEFAPRVGYVQLYKPTFCRSSPQKVYQRISTLESP